jgi:hypothetical protein
VDFRRCTAGGLSSKLRTGTNFIAALDEGVRPSSNLVLERPRRLKGAL